MQGELRIPKIAGKIGVYIILVVGAIIFVGPFLWNVYSSFKVSWEIMGKQSLQLPTVLTGVHYIELFEAIPVAQNFLNSAIVTLAVVSSNLLFSSMTGYALAKLRFFGRDFLFIIIIATLVLPFQVVFIPLYILIARGFHLANTLAGVFLPSLMGAIPIFFFRQFYTTIPTELIDASRIDGCSHFGSFFRIVLPNSKSALITIAILAGTDSWNLFLWPLVVIKDTHKFTVQLALTLLQKQAINMGWGRLLAGCALFSIPPLILVLVLQRYFMESIALTGLKR